MAKINLFGASGHAKVIIDIIRAQGNEVGRVYDDNPHCQELCGASVFKASEIEVEYPLIVSIGSCQARRCVSERYNGEFATAIHPSAIISNSARIGEGSVVMPGAIVNADVTIGKHCIVNTKASIDHECQIWDYVHIAPGCTLSGNVEVGECSWIGVGSCIKQGIKIGKNCMIGAVR